MGGRCELDRNPSTDRFLNDLLDTGKIRLNEAGGGGSGIDQPQADSIRPPAFKFQFTDQRIIGRSLGGVFLGALPDCLRINRPSRGRIGLLRAIGSGSGG